MSGVYCDGCGEGSLLRDPAGQGAEPAACDLCGWKCDLRNQPRKWMDDEGIPWTKRQRKAAGKLFFLWVTLDPKKDEAVFGVMEALGLDGMSWGAGRESLVELERKPSEDALRKIAAVDGVLHVRLAP